MDSTIDQYQYPNFGSFYPEALLNDSITIKDCVYCEDGFFNEPPPVMSLPPPPIMPTFQSAASDLLLLMDKDHASAYKYDTLTSACSFCSFLNPSNSEANTGAGPVDGRLVGILSALLVISFAFVLYLLARRWQKVLITLRAFNSNNTSLNQSDKNSSSYGSNSRPHSSDQSYYQNLTSPIISDVSRNKTSIPSKCWSQPGSVICSTVRRVPNEYEIPHGQQHQLHYVEQPQRAQMIVIQPSLCNSKERIYDVVRC